MQQDSPDRVVDYPPGLRSQGPEFKSPSGRFYEELRDERSEESVFTEALWTFLFGTDLREPSALSGRYTVSTET